MHKRMPILLLLVLTVSVAYTTWRLWRILPFPGWGKWLVSGLYLLSFACFFLHQRLTHSLPLRAAVVTYEVGTSWMIVFLYALIIFLLLDLGRLVRLVPASFLKDSVAGTCTVLGVIAALLVYGGLNYHHKYREEIELVTDKPLEGPLTIVMASDLHVGYHNRKAELDRWVDLINSENPDLVLFAGDILDRDIRPVRAWRYDEEFRRIAAPVYAVPGNHEYYTGIDNFVSFYADAGINLLRDSSAVVRGIRVVGRDDRSRQDRAPLGDLTARDGLFTLLLDHQPFHLEEAEACGIDFQFSGHTHYGQVWPASWVTDIIYEKAFGPHQRGNTRYYVSSGLGIWGGKFRIGTRSEYIVLKIHGK